MFGRGGRGAAKAGRVGLREDVNYICSVSWQCQLKICPAGRYPFRKILINNLICLFLKNQYKKAF